MYDRAYSPVCGMQSFRRESTPDSEDQQTFESMRRVRKRCGPAFVKYCWCQSTTFGILSEFERDLDSEFCQHVESGWWNNEILQNTGLHRIQVCSMSTRAGETILLE
jgi:hypothetical protein